MSKIIQFPSEKFENERIRLLKKYNLPETLTLEEMLKFKTFEQIEKEVEKLDIDAVMRIILKLEKIRNNNYEK